MDIATRESELAAYLAKQPYQTQLDGVQLTIAKNVFPSDFGITSSFFGHFMLQQAPGASGLDMGCGSGYFAFILKKMGCQTVLGVDYNLDAVRCAQANVALNPSLAPVEFLHSDVFASVSPRHFDVIVFNFNYYPSNGQFGLNADGGQEILKRFFTQAPTYIDRHTRIYIPFSQFVGAEHDPQRICPDFGFVAETVDRVHNATGEHVIYQVMRA